MNILRNLLKNELFQNPSSETIALKTISIFTPVMQCEWLKKVSPLT